MLLQYSICYIDGRSSLACGYQWMNERLSTPCLGEFFMTSKLKFIIIHLQGFTRRGENAGGNVEKKMADDYHIFCSCPSVISYRQEIAKEIMGIFGS